MIEAWGLSHFLLGINHRMSIFWIAKTNVNNGSSFLYNAIMQLHIAISGFLQSWEIFRKVRKSNFVWESWFYWLVLFCSILNVGTINYYLVKVKLSAFNGYGTAFKDCVPLNLANDQQCRNEFLEFLKLHL